MDAGQLGLQHLIELDLAATQFNAREFDRFAHDGADIGVAAVGLAALHEAADALDDLAGALCLVRGFLQRTEQLVGLEVVGADARGTYSGPVSPSLE